MPLLVSGNLCKRLSGKFLPMKVTRISKQGREGSTKRSGQKHSKDKRGTVGAGRHHGTARAWPRPPPGLGTLQCRQGSQCMNTRV